MEAAEIHLSGSAVPFPPDPQQSAEPVQSLNDKQDKNK